VRADREGAGGERFDAVGSVVYGLALVALMYGLSRLPEPVGIALVASGAFGIAAFVAWELRCPSPVLDIRLFRSNVAFSMSNLAALINYSATAAVSFLLSLYLQHAKGCSPREAGLILLSQPAIMAALSPLAGRLSDRVEPRIVATAGMSLTTVGLVFLALLGEGTPLAHAVAALSFLGLGFALFSSPNTNAVMSSVARRSYGVSSAVLATMRLTGQMLSMGVTMMIIVIVAGRVKIAPESLGLYLKSQRVAFCVFAALCFAGIFASAARGRVRDGAPPSRGGQGLTPRRG